MQDTRAGAELIELRGNVASPVPPQTAYVPVLDGGSSELLNACRDVEDYTDEQFLTLV